MTLSSLWIVSFIYDQPKYSIYVLEGCRIHPSFFFGLFLIIPDYSWLFLSTPGTLLFRLLQIIPILSWLFWLFALFRLLPNYADHMSKLKNCMLVFPLTGAVAAVSNGDYIPHAQKVLCFPPHDAAIQDAPPLQARILWIIAIIATIATIAIIVSM